MQIHSPSSTPSAAAVSDPASKTEDTTLHRIPRVLPVHRGERTLQTIVREIEPLTSEQWTAGGRHFAVVEPSLVDDCGPDESDRTIEVLAHDFAFVRPVRLSRNYGRHAATLAGVAAAVGDRVALVIVVAFFSKSIGWRSA